MATPVLSSPTVLANGCQMTFAASPAFSGALTVDPTKSTITVVSEGYNSSGVLGTISRTVRIVSATGTTTITCELSEPIYDDDNTGAGKSGTAPTVVLDAGAITSATPDSNAALGSTTVTNNSTLDYPTPTSHVWCEADAQWQRVVASFKCRGVSVGPALSGTPNLGIACAELTITDSAANAQTLRQSAWSLVPRMNANGVNPTYPAFEFTVDPNDRDGSGTDFAAGWATLSLAFKPAVGDAASIATATTRVYFQPGGTAVPAVGYIDTTSTLTLSASVASSFTGWNYVKGTTSGAVGILIGTQSGSTLLVTVLTADASGNISPNFATNETITEYTDVACTAATGVTATSHASTAIVQNGNDTTGALNNRSLPYRTPQECFFDAEAASGGTASGCRGKVLRGAVRFGPYNFGTRFSTANGCLVMEPYDGADGGSAAVSAGTTADTCRLLGNYLTGEGGFDVDGFRTQFIRMTGFCAMVRTGHVPWRTAGGADGTDADGEHIVLDNIRLLGAGRADTAVFNMFNGFERIAVMGCSLADSWEGVRGQITVDSRNTNIGQDIWSNTSDCVVVNSYGNGHQESGAGAHSGAWQVPASGTNTNMTLWCSETLLANGSAMPFTKQNASGTINRLGMFGCWLDTDDTSNNSRLEGGTITNCFDIQNSKNGSSQFVGSGTAAFSNIYMRNSVHTSFHYEVTAGAINQRSAWWNNCHNIATSVGSGPRPTGLNATTGAEGGYTEFDGLFSSKRASSATIFDRVPTPAETTYDASGRPLSTDAAALPAIGAYQPAATLTATVDGNAITSGGSAAASGTTGGSTTLVFTVGGPTGAVLVVDAGSVGGGLSDLVPPTLPRTLTSGGTTTTATFTATLGTSPGTFSVGTVELADFTGTVTWSSGSDFPFRSRMGGSFRNPTGGFRRR